MRCPERSTEPAAASSLGRLERRLGRALTMGVVPAGVPAMDADDSRGGDGAAAAADAAADTLLVVREGLPLGVRVGVAEGGVAAGGVAAPVATPEVLLLRHAMVSCAQRRVHAWSMWHAHNAQQHSPLAGRLLVHAHWPSRQELPASHQPEWMRLQLCHRKLQLDGFREQHDVVIESHVRTETEPDLDGRLRVVSAAAAEAEAASEGALDTRLGVVPPAAPVLALGVVPPAAPVLVLGVRAGVPACAQVSLPAG